MLEILRENILTLLQNRQVFLHCWRADFNRGGNSSAARQTHDKNSGERLVDACVGDGVALPAAVSLPAGRLRHTRRNDSAAHDFVSIRRGRRDVGGLCVRADNHLARPVHRAPRASAVRLPVAVHVGGLGGNFSVTKSFRDDFGLRGTIRVSFYFGRDFLRVVCARRFVADNLFADGKRNVARARSVDLLRDFEVLARRKNFVRHERLRRSTAMRNA